MSWTFGKAVDTFPRHRALWEELHETVDRHVLLDFEFVQRLIRHFGSPNTLCGVANRSDMRGMVLIEKVRPGMWQTFQPSQAPVGVILLAGQADRLASLRALIRRLPGCALSLGILQQDPALTTLHGIENAEIVERVTYMPTARLSVPIDFAAYWKTRSRNLLHNLSRQRRRISEQGGQLQLVIDREPEHVTRGVHAYGELESRGWKAREGTALSPDNAQGRFYSDVLTHFSARGEAVVYRLKMGDRTLAIDLCLERGDMLVILKTTHDESLEGLSPGLLLHEEIVRTLSTEGRIRTVEFYGRTREWHKKLTDDVREMFHLNLSRFAWLGQLQRSIRKIRTARAERQVAEHGSSRGKQQTVTT
jgi:CelD/BcsL family acetyltransferase involved in cellulose biosynthesis